MQIKTSPNKEIHMVVHVHVVTLHTAFNFNVLRFLSFTQEGSQMFSSAVISHYIQVSTKINATKKVYLEFTLTDIT